MEKKLKRKEYFVKICQIISLAGVGFKVQIYEVDSSNDPVRLREYSFLLTLKKNIACYVSDACENIRTRPEGTTKEHDLICSRTSPAIPELCLRKVVVIYNELINRSIDQSLYLPLIFFLHASLMSCMRPVPLVSSIPNTL